MALSTLQGINTSVMIASPVTSTQVETDDSVLVSFELPAGSMLIRVQFWADVVLSDDAACRVTYEAIENTNDRSGNTTSTAALPNGGSSTLLQAALGTKAEYGDAATEPPVFFQYGATVQVRVTTPAGGGDGNDGVLSALAEYVVVPS